MCSAHPHQVCKVWPIKGGLLIERRVASGSQSSDLSQEWVKGGGEEGACTCLCVINQTRMSCHAMPCYVMCVQFVTGMTVGIGCIGCLCITVYQTCVYHGMK